MCWFAAPHAAHELLAVLARCCKVCMNWQIVFSRHMHAPQRSAGHTSQWHQLWLGSRAVVFELPAGGITHQSLTSILQAILLQQDLGLHLISRYHGRALPLHSCSPVAAGGSRACTPH